MNTYDATTALAEQHRARLVADARRHTLVALARRRRPNAPIAVESASGLPRPSLVTVDLDIRSVVTAVEEECRLG